LKKSWKEFILFGIAACLAGVILLAGCREEEKQYTYDIVFLGDSIVGNMDHEVSITGVLEERLGKTVFNGGLGGSCMSYNNEEVFESDSNAQWSMVKLAQAIYAEDFSSQLAAVTYAEKYRSVNMQILDYFYDRIMQLSRIDFSQTEVLLIEHGTNDYNCGQKLESATDPMDPMTFAGALRRSLSLLREKYPDLRIILVSPIYCEIEGDGLYTCLETDFGGGTLDAYVQKEKEIAQEYGVEWIDMFYESGIWEDNLANYLYDGLHPSAEGILLLGNLIADYLESGQ